MVNLYREEGVARLASLDSTVLPQLDPVLPHNKTEPVIAVLEKRGNWLLISYDDAGRSGWIRMERHWDYIPWKDFLKGCWVRLLAGLKKSWYELRAEPSETAPVLSRVQERNLRVVEVQEDWCMIIADSGTLGWVRWRDGDGRLLIAVNPGCVPQKH